MRPVEGREWVDPETRDAAGDGRQIDVVRGDPSHPVEERECLETKAESWFVHPTMKERDNKTKRNGN